jgi:hypothetical protein
MIVGYTSWVSNLGNSWAENKLTSKIIASRRTKNKNRPPFLFKVRIFTNFVDYWDR